MAKKDFFIAEYLKPEDVSKSDTTAPTIELIDIDAIESNEANFYELSNLQPLADSILMDGLQQPLVVTTSPEDPAKVRLLSGHRRRAAIQMLIDDAENPHPELRRIPCIRKTYTSTAMAELQLILANSTARELTPAEKMKQAEKIEALLCQLKEEGYSFPGRMRDQVAAACNASASKLARLKVIRDNLCDEAMSMFERSTINESVAYRLAQSTVDVQEKILASSKEPERLSEWQIRDRTLWLENISKIMCGSNARCANADRMFAEKCKDSNRYNYLQCAENGECCKDCSKLYTCKSACKAFTDKIKNQAADEARRKAKAESEAEQNKRKQIAENKKQWVRLAAARQKAGLAPAEVLQELRNINCYNFPSSEQTMVKFENGECNDSYSCNILAHLTCLEVAFLANLYKCSADYLLGRSDEPTLYKGEWKTASEELPKSGEYVLALSKWGVVYHAVYYNHGFMDVTEKSVGNLTLPNIDYWAKMPCLPDGMKFNGEETIKELTKGF